MNILVDKNWETIRNKVVKSVWNLYQNKYKLLGIEYGDFESISYIILDKELKCFDETKSSIYTHATQILKTRMCDYIRNNYDTDKTRANFCAQSLNVPTSNGSEIEMVDMIVDESTVYSPESNITKIKRFLKTLSNRQKDILFLRTIGLDSMEIQEVLSISAEAYLADMKKIKSPRRTSILRKEVQ